MVLPYGRQLIGLCMYVDPLISDETFRGIKYCEPDGIVSSQLSLMTKHTEFFIINNIRVP